MVEEKKSTEDLPFISVIIPARDPGKMLEDCLAPFQAASYPAFEVLVVDDASSPPVKLPGSSSERFRLLHLSMGSGPAVARNEGAEKAKGDVLLFIDTDVVVGDDCLERVAGFFRESGGRPRGLTGVQAVRMGYRNFSSRYKNLWMRYSFLRAPEESALFYTSIGAVPRKLFREMGGFDRRYRSPSLEDTDFGNRIWARGGRIKIIKDLEVRHNKYYSLAGLLKNDFLRASEETRSWLRNFGKSDSLFRGRTSVPLGYIWGLAGAGLAAAGALSIMFFSPLPGLIAFGVGLVVLWLGNLKMMLWMRKAGGNGFFIRTLFFLFLDLLVAGAGIIWGIIGYLAGKKY